MQTKIRIGYYNIGIYRWADDVVIQLNGDRDLIEEILAYLDKFKPKKNKNPMSDFVVK